MRASTMVLQASTGLGPFEVVFLIRAGGMGRFLGLEPASEAANFTFLFNWLTDVPSTATRPAP